MSRKAELMQAATALAQQYDAITRQESRWQWPRFYARMACWFAPSGSIVRGRQALTTYYANRFASGARGHAIKVVEAHVRQWRVWPYPITVTVRARMAIFANSTAASSWSIDATPMDGTCASSNERAGVADQ